MGAHSKPNRTQRRRLRLLFAAAAAAGVMGGTLHMAGAIPINPGPLNPGEPPSREQVERILREGKAAADRLGDVTMSPIEDYANVEWAKQRLGDIQQGIDEGTVDPDDPAVQEEQLDLLDVINGAPDTGDDVTVPTLPEDFDEVDDGAGEDVDDVDRDHLMTLDDYFTFDWNGRGYVG